jgi:hypothetical protein
MEAFDQVDWDAMGLAMKRSMPSKRRLIVKHSTGFCRVEFELQKSRQSSCFRNVRSSEKIFRRQQENDQSLRGMRECMRRFVAPTIC